MSANISPKGMMGSLAVSVSGGVITKVILDSWPVLPLWSQWTISVVVGGFILITAIMILKKTETEKEKSDIVIAADIKAQNATVQGIQAESDGSVRIASGIETTGDVNIGNITSKKG